MTVASGPPADIVLLVGERAGFLFLEVGDFADKCLTRGHPDKLWRCNIENVHKPDSVSGAERFSCAFLNKGYIRVMRFPLTTHVT